MSDVLLAKTVPTAGMSKVDFGYPYEGSVIYWNDFLEWTSANASATDNSAVWRQGCAGTPTFLPTNDLDGGGVTLTTTTTNDDEAGLQLGGASFFCVAKSTSSNRGARRVRAVCRMKASSITAAKQYFGLFVKDQVTTGPLSPATGTQPIGLGFLIENGAVNYISKPHSGSAVTATATGFGSIAINTFYDFAIEMDENNGFTFLVNGKPYVTISGAATPLSATVGLSPAFGVKCTTGAAMTLIVDYVGVAVEAPVGGR